MKRMIVSALIVFVLFVSASAHAAVRYILPEGFYYNEDGYIVTPEGQVCENIWDAGLEELSWSTTNIDREYMAKLGDGRADILLLCGAAVVAVSGAVFAHRKAKHAAA